MNFMKDWPIRAKLGVVAAIVFGLIVYLASQSVRKFYGEYDFAQQEKMGSDYLKNYFSGDAWFAVMSRRAAVVRFLGGDKSTEAMIPEATSKVDAAIAVLHENDKKYNNGHDHSARLQKNRFLVV